MNDYYEVWADQDPLSGGRGMSLRFAVIDDQDARDIATGIESNDLATEIWHIEYTDGIRTATLITP